MDYQPQFALMVNTELTWGEFLGLLRRSWGDRDWLTPTTIERNDNLVNVRRNEDAEINEGPIADPLDYPFEIEVTPLIDNPITANQAALAKQMLAELVRLGLETSIVADFEELLR